MKEFLDNDEVKLLTGKSTKTAQIEWLTKNNWRFECNAAGAPVVNRFYCRERMSGKACTFAGSLPNFGAVK